VWLLIGCAVLLVLRLTGRTAELKVG